MSQTIIEKLLKGAEVEWKPLWKVTIWDKKFNGVEHFKQPKTIKYHYLLASELKALAIPNGSIKLLTTSTTNYWTSEKLAKNKINNGEIVAIPWGGDINVQYYNGKFITADNRILTSVDKEFLDNKYLYYFFNNNYRLLKSFYRGSGIKHPNMAGILDILVPIPPLSVQQEIVGILDAFTAHTAELTAELNERKKQYNYYRDKLLTFSDDEVEWKTVEEIVTTVTPPLKIPRGKYKLSGNIPIVDQGENFIAGYTDNADAALPENEYIIFGDHTEYIKYVDFSFAQGADGLKILKPNRDLAKYVYYAFLNFYNKTGNYKRHWTDAKKILLPIVSIKAQKRIVSILDKFDALTTSISEGLPREIELRNKQYEYYRDQLLNFSKPDLEN